jgi:hypothetical protein
MFNNNNNNNMAFHVLILFRHKLQCDRFCPDEHFFAWDGIFKVEMYEEIILEISKLAIS